MTWDRWGRLKGQTHTEPDNGVNDMTEPEEQDREFMEKEELTAFDIVELLRSEDAVAAWLGHRGDEAAPLFMPIDKSGALQPQRLGDHAVYMALRKRAHEAGVAEFSPHDLRRTFVSHLLGRGADLSTVQRLAGHAQISTTARYDRRGEEAKRKASELLLVPYVGPA